MADFRYPDSQIPYSEAVTELNPDELPTKIEVAEMAIRKRLEFLSDDANHEGESEAIENARTYFRILKRYC